MKFIVDAWLERPVPHINIINAEDGQVQLHFSSGMVERLLTQGNINSRDLSRYSAASVTELLDQLVADLPDESMENSSADQACLLEWRKNHFTVPL